MKRFRAVAMPARGEIAGRGHVALVVGPLSLLLALVASGNGAAMTPAIDTFSLDETFPIVACAGFDVIRHVVSDVIVTVFFDQNGDPTTLRLHITEHNEVFNSLTGTALDFPGILNIAIDLKDGTMAVSGAPITVTVQYTGIVIQDTGLLILDSEGNMIFEAGSHDFGPSGDPSVFCSLLE